MTEAVDRELEAILKLIKLTQEGDLKWRSSQPWGDLIQSDARTFASVFVCDFEGKKLRVFFERNRKDKPSSVESMFSSFSVINDAKSYPFWVKTSVLEITNSEGQTLWRFPHKPATADLLKAVQYQVAGVKDVIDSLLSK